MEILLGVALVAALASLVLLVVLVVRRTALTRRERRRRTIEERLRPAALVLVDDGEAPPAMSRRDGDVFAGLLARYGRVLRSEPRRRIGAWFEASGRLATELEALSSRRPWRRAGAAMRLGDIGSPAAVPALLDALGDLDREVRTAAARSLGRLEATEAVVPIAKTLAGRGLPHVVGGQALLNIGPAAVAPLTELTSDADPALRAVSIELVGLTGDAGDAMLAIDLLDDASATVRGAAAHALSRLGAERATTALRRRLDDPEPLVRSAAADALGAARDNDAVGALVEMARSDEFEPAAAAARALAVIDPATVVSIANRPDAGQHLAEAADAIRALGP